MSLKFAVDFKGFGSTIVTDTLILFSLNIDGPLFTNPSLTFFVEIASIMI